MLTIEDACEFGKPLDDEPWCIDCGSCCYCRQSDDCLAFAVTKNAASH